MINILNKHLNHIKKSHKIADIILDAIKNDLLNQVSVKMGHLNQDFSNFAFYQKFKIEDLGLSESYQKYISSNIFMNTLFKQYIYKTFEITVDNIKCIMFVNKISRSYNRTLKVCRTITTTVILFSEENFKRFYQRNDNNILTRALHGI